MEDRKEDEDGDSRSRKIHSFSQPLAMKRNAIGVDNNDPDPSPFYHHYRSSSTDNNYQIRHSYHQIRNPDPNLPLPIPPHHYPNNSSSGSLISRHHHDSSSFSSDGAATLDWAMSEFGGGPGSLPEFLGTGGGTGIFQVPIRAAMHPSRPPALELRPHPLRETQFSAFLRTILCSETEIWAGQESGLRCWKLDEVFDGWSGRGGVKRGDEESAPFKESGKTSGTMCMEVDLASGLLWSGHKDGKIRSWRIGNGKGCVGDEEVENGGGFYFKEGLSWQAHRTPVLSMVISSYGIHLASFPP